MSLYLGNIKISGVNVIFNDGAGSDVNETNIKTGITILGVTGTYTENGTQMAGQEIATADKIVNGYSAWVDGNEVQGSLDINNYYTGTDDPPSSLGNNGDIYLKK